MTPRDTHSQSQSSVVATDAVTMVTADKRGTWLEPGAIVSSHQLGTDDAFVDDGDATDAHFAASSAMLDATSAARDVAWSGVAAGVHRVTGRTSSTLAQPAGRLLVTSQSRGRDSCDAAVGQHVTSSRRYVTPPRFRTAR